MSCLKVVILEKFFILEVTIFGLNRVELVAQGKVVFVSLLDLEDLGFELADEQVFLWSKVRKYQLYFGRRAFGGAHWLGPSKGPNLMVLLRA